MRVLAVADGQTDRYTDRRKLIFTALHEMQTRSSDENSVRQSVCPSVCQTRDL